MIDKDLENVQKRSKKKEMYDWTSDKLAGD